MKQFLNCEDDKSNAAYLIFVSGIHHIFSRILISNNKIYMVEVLHLVSKKTQMYCKLIKKYLTTFKKVCSQEHRCFVKLYFYKPINCP